MFAKLVNHVVGKHTSRAVKLELPVFNHQLHVLTGEIIDAREAERIGLVNKVIPHEDLMAATRAMGKKILEKGPLAVRLAKAALNSGVKWGPDAGMAIERLAQSCLMTTEDKREGTTAFLEKRRANFQGI